MPKNDIPANSLLNLDLDMMKHPDRWPHLVLPLKRSRPGADRELGILLGVGSTVYLCNMWDTRPFADVPQKKYDSLEAVIADGWRVD